jgi:hypothetical protein
VCVGAVLVACVAFAAPTVLPEEERTLDGLGRIGLQLGYRWVPNNYFYGKAGEAGYPLDYRSPGGGAAAIGFGYGATSFVEGAVDIFINYEQLHLKNTEALNSTSYGALFGARFGKMDFPVHNLYPYLGFQVGPVLGIVNSDNYKNGERLTTGYMGVAGLTWRVTERIALVFDVRYLLARSYVTGISGVNVGGLMVTLGFTTYFAGQSNKPPNSDLITPIE